MSKKHETVLDNLNSDEAGAVLSKLLVAHPHLKDEAEQIAKSLVSNVSFESIAEGVESALRVLDLEDLNSRAGSHQWGYVEPTEAAWDLLGEEIEFFQEEMKRYLKLGLQKEALEVCKGILLGLYRARHEESGYLLGWAPDFPKETACLILEEWKEGQQKTVFPQDFAIKNLSDWELTIKGLI